MKTGWMRIALAGLLVAGLGPVMGGCAALDWPDIWDSTCYDCRTVCDGTVGEVLDDCLACCYECQGRSACFEVLDGLFDGQALERDEWKQVPCSSMK